MVKEKTVHVVVVHYYDLKPVVYEVMKSSF